MVQISCKRPGLGERVHDGSLLDTRVRAPGTHRALPVGFRPHRWCPHTPSVPVTARQLSTYLLQKLCFLCVAPPLIIGTVLLVPVSSRIYFSSFSSFLDIDFIVFWLCIKIDDMLWLNVLMRSMNFIRRWEWNFFFKSWICNSARGCDGTCVLVCYYGRGGRAGLSVRPAAEWAGVRLASVSSVYVQCGSLDGSDTLEEVV